MKAKEYVKRYQKLVASGDQEITIWTVCNEMIKEIPVICKQRKAESNDAQLSVFKEIDQKYRAFARLLNDPTVREDGLARVMRSRFPNLCMHLDMHGALKVRKEA